VDGEVETSYGHSWSNAEAFGESNSTEKVESHGLSCESSDTRMFMYQWYIRADNGLMTKTKNFICSTLQPKCPYGYCGDAEC
jgi:hypothetical protein